MSTRVGAILEKPRTTYCFDNGVRFGFVGGPVFNGEGKPVGVVGYDLSQNEGGDLYTRSGHPLVYQAALFRKYIVNPPSENEVRKGEAEGWLGVFAQALTDDLAEYWGLPKEGGIVVSTVMAGAPAEASGLRMGDVILSFDGTPLRARTDREVTAFTKLLRDTPVGKKVQLDVLREGKPVTVTATLSARPKSSRDAEEYSDKTFGLTVREITTDVRILLNLSEDVKGVIVRRVESGSVAASARMKPGLIVMGFGDHPVSNLAEFTRALELIERDKPDEVAVFCRYGTATGFFRMEPRW
jgi:serine protease Do